MTLSVEQNSPAHPGRDRRSWLIEANLRPAEDECRHGRLPGDRSDPCGCWRELEAPVALPPRRRATTTRREAA